MIDLILLWLACSKLPRSTNMGKRAYMGAKIKTKSRTGQLVLACLEANGIVNLKLL